MARQEFEMNNQSEIIFKKQKVSLNHFFFKKKKKEDVVLDFGNEEVGASKKEKAIISERQILERICHRYILNLLEIIGNNSYPFKRKF